MIWLRRNITARCCLIIRQGTALTPWLACGRSLQGVLVIHRGDVVTGLRLLRAGFDEFGDARYTGFRLTALLMAEALGRAGQNDDGLAAIEEAIARAERTEEHWAMAELLRVKGELLLLQGALGAAAASRGSLQASARLGTPTRRVVLGTPRCHEPRGRAGRPWCRSGRRARSRSAPRSSLAENLASASGRCTLSSRPFGKTAVDREVLRAVPVREYGAEQPVRLAVDPVREVEGIGIAVAAADPELEGPKPARRMALADIDRDRPTELPGRRVEGVDPAIEKAREACRPVDG